MSLSTEVLKITLNLTIKYFKITKYSNEKQYEPDKQITTKMARYTLAYQENVKQQDEVF